MDITPPSTPPPPLTPEEEKLIEEAKKVFATLKDRPLASPALHERASDAPLRSDEENDDTPLI